MKTKLFTLFAVIFFLLSGNIQAKKVLLRFNLEKGAQYNMVMDVSSTIDQAVMGQDVDINQKMNMVFNWKVLDITPDKTFLVEYAFEKMKMEMSVNGQNLVFSTDSTEESTPAFSSALKDLSKIKLQLEITDQGKIVSVKGMDELLSKFSGNQVLAQSMQMFTNESNFESFMGQTFNYFPEKEIGKGDTWTSSMKLPAMMNMDTKMDFEVADITDDVVKLNVNSLVNIDSPIEQAGMKMQVKMDGTQKGTMDINLKDGWLESSDLVQEFSMQMKLKNPQTGEDMEIPMKVQSTAKMTGGKK